MIWYIFAICSLVDFFLMVLGANIAKSSILQRFHHFLQTMFTATRAWNWEVAKFFTSLNHFFSLRSSCLFVEKETIVADRREGFVGGLEISINRHLKISNYKEVKTKKKVAKKWVITGLSWRALILEKEAVAPSFGIRIVARLFEEHDATCSKYAWDLNRHQSPLTMSLFSFFNWGPSASFLSNVKRRWQVSQIFLSEYLLVFLPLMSYFKSFAQSFAQSCWSMTLRAKKQANIQTRISVKLVTVSSRSTKKRH